MSATEWQRKIQGRLSLLPPLLIQTYSLTDIEVVRPKDAVASMIKRLAHRNANVQLYTLEVRTTYTPRR